MEDVIVILPNKIKNIIKDLINVNFITEIRFRVDKKLIVYFGTEEKVLDYIVENEDIIDILKNVSMGSIYSIQNELNKGFITIKGGHRIGIAGKVVVVDGFIKNIKEISSLNIRVSHELVGVSNEIMPYILKDNNILNTLIVSKPCMGKTTILRDIVRNLSNYGFNTVVVDERGEIASLHDGKTNLDLGCRTDVISYVDKEYGIKMAIRSLNPSVICTDEMGDKTDINSIYELSKSGVKFITTMHGDSLKDIKLSSMNEILQNGYLDNVIILGDKPGTVKKIYCNLKNKEEMVC